MRQYVIGVDGGGTKTHYALCDTAGELLAFWRGGCANHEMCPDGYSGVRRELEPSLDRLLREGGVSRDAIAFLYLGLAGVDVAAQRDALAALVREIGFARFQIVNDAFLGIKAATRHGYGVCSINGTGTCCAAIDRRGAALQIGGTGYYFGDEGGGGHLGGMAFRRVYDSLYRCGPPTLMQELLYEVLQIEAGADLTEAVYRRQMQQNWTPLARLPFLAANQGDPVALELLRHTGREAARAVAGAIRRLDFDAVAEVEVVMAGSLYLKGEHPALTEAFAAEARSLAGERLRFIRLAVPPVSGAVCGALEALGIPLDAAARERVRRSFTALPDV